MLIFYLQRLKNPILLPVLIESMALQQWPLAQVQTQAGKEQCRGPGPMDVIMAIKLDDF